MELLASLRNIAISRNSEARVGKRGNERARRTVICVRVCTVCTLDFAADSSSAGAICGRKERTELAPKAILAGTCAIGAPEGTVMGTCYVGLV